MRKLGRFMLRCLMAVAGIVAICWVGTRNLSDTSGSEVVKVAEANRRPNNDFTFCTNPSIRRRDCRNYPVDGKSHPYTCINTATSFYDKHNTCSLCADFVRMPGKWGFHEVEPDERKPGDLVVFYYNGKASHAAVYIGESLFGPLMDQSDGGYIPFDYQRHVPYKPLMWLLWERARYYRK